MQYCFRPLQTVDLWRVILLTAAFGSSSLSTFNTIFNSIRFISVNDTNDFAYSTVLNFMLPTDCPLGFYKI